MTDAPAIGFRHYHSDEELRAWMDMPPQRKLEWLDDALAVTRAMLPESRRGTWLAMRGERPGAAISINVLRSTWPAFQRALDDSGEALVRWANERVAAGASPADVRETLRALGAWAAFRSGAKAEDRQRIAAALQRLRR